MRKTELTPVGLELYTWQPTNVDVVLNPIGWIIAAQTEPDVMVGPTVTDRSVSWPNTDQVDQLAQVGPLRFCWCDGLPPLDRERLQAQIVQAGAGLNDPNILQILYSARDIVNGSSMKPTEVEGNRVYARPIYSR